MENLSAKFFLVLITPLFFLNSLHAQQPKNVLFIVADDFNSWMGEIGYYPQAITPNLDALSQRGVLFANTYSPSAVCNPSRNAMMSGYRPNTTQLYRNSEGYIRGRPGFANITTLNQYFTEQAYYTYAGGKIYHPELMGSLESDAVNWSGLYTDSVGSPGGNLFNWKADNHAQLGWSVGEFDLNTAGDTKLANHMAQFLQNYTPANHGGKPFLAAVGFYRPHLPWDIHRQFWDMYDEDTLDIPQGYLINDLDDHVGQDTTLHREVVSEGKWKEGIHAYLAGISYADYNVGILLDALENSPHKDNTIIVFLGDHGWHLGEKSIWDKAHHYQRAFHTSLIIYDPGAEGNGAKCMKPVSLQDLYPTLVEIAGLEPKTDIEGESLVPLLADPQDPNWYRPVIMTNRGHNAIRTDEYRMFVHPREAQLYRVDQDPWEFHNLYDQPGYGTVISSLNSQIAEINQVGQDLKAKLLNNYQFIPTLNILPGIVEGENYDEGVNKHSYFDKSSGNSGTEYRGDKVDIFSGSGAVGNLYLGDLEDGEWLNYTLYDVPSALYQIRFRISNINVSPGQELEVFLGTKSLGAVSIPGTSSLDDWVYVTLPDVQLNTQGSRILKLLVKQGNFQLDHIKFDLSDPSDCASQPNIIISPVGPFSSDQEIQQLNAFPSGGIWSGAATPNGDFDPGQGTGLYEVIYSVVFNDTCSKADTLIIEVEEANSGGECTAPINLALGQPTQQSSTRGNGISSIAVDGDTEGTGNNWVENPKITHTEKEVEPWWQVDLGQEAAIEQINIYNRTGCCTGRLKDFYVLVSSQPFGNNSLNQLLNSPNVQSTFFAGAAGAQVDIPFVVGGRYLRLQLSSNNQPLHIAEVQVMGCPSEGNDPCTGQPNVSIDAAGPFTTDQGIQQLNGNPSGGTWSGAANAEGTFDPNQGAGTYTVTYTYDFGNGCIKSTQANIEVTTPADPCAGRPNVTIDPAGPFTTDQGVQQLSGNPSGGDWSGAANAEGTFDPGQGANSYTVTYTVDFGGGCIKSTDAVITVSNPVIDECTTPLNLALGQPTQQSSTRGNGVSSIAVDGDTEGTGSNWVENPKITHTEKEVEPWWQVDLGQEAAIEEVKIYNRTSCCSNRLKDFYVLVSSQPFGSNSLSELLNSPAVQSTFYSGGVGTQVNIPFVVGGRYLRLQLSSNNQSLHLAEVQVMGCPSEGNDPCTGQPNVSIDAAGPFTTDQGIQQLNGNPSGGTWSGAAIINGTFDPSQGAGTYTVMYTVDFGEGCMKSANASFTVTDPPTGECSAPYNMALNQPSFQSSTNAEGVANFTNDGNLIGDDFTGADANLSHTAFGDNQPWWKVDLGTTANLDRVVLYNRNTTNSKHLARLKNFYLYFSSSNMDGEQTHSSLKNDTNIEWIHFPGEVGSDETIQLNTIEARFVMIKLIGNGPLHIAEWEIYACPNGGSSTRFAMPGESIFAPKIEEKEPQIHLIPNPIDGLKELTVILDVPVSKFISLELYSTEGKLLHREVKKGMITEPEFVLSLAALPAGIYLIRSFGNGWELSERVIKE